MRRLLWLTGAALLLLSHAASAVDEDPRETAVKQFAMPIIANILSGLKASDFTKMSRDFADEFKRTTPPAALGNTIKQGIEPEFGTFVSAEWEGVEEAVGFLTVHYAAKFTKDNNVGIRVVFRKDDPQHKVFGLSIVPSETVRRASKEKADAIRKSIEPVVQNYFEGLRTKNFARMVKDFAPLFRDALPAEKLQEAYERYTVQRFGTFVSAVFDRVDVAPHYTSVYYLATYSKGAQLEVKFTFKSGDPRGQIYGLMERPLQ